MSMPSRTPAVRPAERSRSAPTSSMTPDTIAHVMTTPKNMPVVRHTPTLATRPAANDTAASVTGTARCPAGRRATPTVPA